MDSAGYFMSPNELWALIGTDRAPQIVDTRKRAVSAEFDRGDPVGLFAYLRFAAQQLHNWPAKAA